MRVLAGVVFALLLAACGPSRLYVTPQGKTFPLTFVNQAPKALIILSVFEDDYDCYQRWWPVPMFAEMTTKEIQAKARRHYTVLYGYNQKSSILTGPGFPCSGIATFDVEDAPHRVTTGWDSVASKCIFAIERQTASGWEPAKNITTRKVTQPFADSDGPWCEASPAYKGSSSLPVPRG